MPQKRPYAAAGHVAFLRRADQRAGGRLRARIGAALQRRRPAPVFLLHRRQEAFLPGMKAIVHRGAREANRLPSNSLIPVILLSLYFDIVSVYWQGVCPRHFPVPLTRRGFYLIIVSQIQMHQAGGDVP